MSWEDCGFRPGKVFGPAKCSVGECSECDGAHHFYAETVLLDELNVDGPQAAAIRAAAEAAIESGVGMLFVCKHCEVAAEMIDEDDDDA